MGNIIMGALWKALWDLTVKPILLILDAFSKLFNFVSYGLVRGLIFGEDGSFNLSEGSFPIYWSLFICAVLLIIIIWVIQYFQLQFSEMPPAERVKLSGKNTIIAIFWIVALPFIFMVVTIFMSIALDLLFNAFGIADGTSWADMVYAISLNNYNGNINDPAIIIKANYGAPTYGTANFIIAIVASILMLIAVMKSVLVLLLKSAELYITFVLSPLVAGTMVSDDGAKWKNHLGKIKGKFIAMIAIDIAFLAALSLFPLFLKAITPFIEGTNEGYNGIKSALYSVPTTRASAAGSYVLQQAWAIVCCMTVYTFLQTGPSTISEMFGGEDLTSSYNAVMAPARTLMRVGMAAAMGGAGLAVGAASLGANLLKTRRNSVTGQRGMSFTQALASTRATTSRFNAAASAKVGGVLGAVGLSAYAPRRKPHASVPKKVSNVKEDGTLMSAAERIQAQRQVDLAHFSQGGFTGSVAKTMSFAADSKAAKAVNHAEKTSVTASIAQSVLLDKMAEGENGVITKTVSKAATKVSTKGQSKTQKKETNHNAKVEMTNIYNEAIKNNNKLSKGAKKHLEKLNKQIQKHDNDKIKESNYRDAKNENIKQKSQNAEQKRYDKFKKSKK